MKLNTASETLSFLREQEERLAVFYEDLAQRFPEHADTFKAFAQENRKYNKQIQMAYQSVITDAIEGCYAFDLEVDDYTFDTDLPQGADLAQAAARALEMENKILACYTLGAEQSSSLLADVPRNFKIVLRKRKPRLEKLQAMT